MTFNQCTFINSKFRLINSYKHALLFTGGLVNFNSHQPEEAAHVHTIRGHNTTGRQHLKHALLRRSGTTLSLSFISALHALCLDAFVTSPNYPEITSRWCTKLSSKTCLFLLGVPLFLFLFFQRCLLVRLFRCKHVSCLSNIHLQPANKGSICKSTQTFPPRDACVQDRR